MALQSKVEPIAKKVDMFAQQLTLFKNELQRGHYYTITDISVLCNKFFTFKRDAETEQADLVSKLNQHASVQPKPGAGVAKYVAYLVYIAKEIAAIVKLITSLIKIGITISEILAIYAANVISAVVEIAAGYAAAAAKYLKEQVIDKALKEAQKKYNKMMRNVQLKIKHARYSAKVKALNYKIEQLIKSAETSETSEQTSAIVEQITIAEFERAEYEKLLENIKQLQAELDNGD